MHWPPHLAQVTSQVAGEPLGPVSANAQRSGDEYELLPHLSGRLRTPHFNANPTLMIDPDLLIPTRRCAARHLPVGGAF